MGSKKSGSKPGKASEVRCSVACTRLSHLAVQDTDVVPKRKPHVKNANGIPRTVVLVLLATPLMVSSSMDNDEGDTQVASLHRSERPYKQAPHEEAVGRSAQFA